ncbi:MAG: hypothetical protein FJZ01_09985 [Candidatus Sericytochromatia bacterium]|nr:hypothetical protein [Candidatus Tanganyikabacteria bacterium]
MIGAISNGRGFQPLAGGAPGALAGAPAPYAPVFAQDSVPSFRATPDRVFLFHGVDVRGFRDHGRGALEDLAGRLRGAGFPEAAALHYNSDNWWLNQLAVLRERLFGTFSKRLTAQILADLQARPLQPGQRISLAGYSLGSLVAARVAANLAQAGVPVGTLVLIEPKNGGAPSAVSSLPPGAAKVVLIENQADLRIDNPYAQPFVFQHVPGKTHYDMVENPDEQMIQTIVSQLR